MTFKCCAIVPSFNHCEMVDQLVRHLRDVNLPVFVIDDGSDEPTRATLSALHAPEREVIVCRFDTNRGKGAAVMKGFDLARAAGFTHALQIDADGQHDLSDLAEFIALAEAHPDALIAGSPIHDVTMPRGRRIGRSITHFWVGIETLTKHPVDSMCGMRLYPLEPVTKLRSNHRLGRRMDFDIEIFVRAIWEGIPVFLVPVRVVYPRGNISNFDLIRDNWAITAMHTRLVLTMPLHLARILRNRRQLIDAPNHWASVAERGAYWGLGILAFFYKVAGRYGCMAAVFPIALYFNLTSPKQRRASREFLRRAYRANGIDYDPGWLATFKHSFGFARKTVDTFAAWLGGIDPAAIVAKDKLGPDGVAQSGQGILLIVSHLGNIEISDWVAIAGDRTPVRGDERISIAPFLGHDAPFPQGPYVLAHLLECPVYLMFCIRQDGVYRLYFEMFAERIKLPRRDKQAAIGEWAARYAKRLESFCLIDPFQWYNFYDFWQTPHSPEKAAAQ